MYIIKDVIKNHKPKIIIAIIIIVLIILNIYTLSLIDFEDSQPIVIEEKTKTKEKIKVDIKGEINKAGLYEIEKGSRIADLIEKAGGLTKNADTSIINLSKKLKDEMVIIIYSKNEVAKLKEDNEVKCNCPEVNDGCIKDEDTEELLIEKDQSQTTEKNTEKNTSQTKTNEKISINTATQEELQAISGIGEAKAKAIIEYRQTNGKFKTLEDLKNIKGIGESLFEKIKNQISL